MTFFHVWQSGDKVPTVLTDNATLQAFLATLSGTIVVNRYDTVHAQTLVYGVPGGLEIPTGTVTVNSFTPISVPHIANASGQMF